MKKIISFLLVFVQMLGLGTPVLAEENDGQLNDMESIEFIKNLEVQGENPAETFEFTVGEGTVTDGSAETAPTIKNFDIAVGQGNTSNTVTVDLPTFDTVGTYEYDIQEKENNTAGMTYDTAKRTLVVQAFLQDEEIVRVAYLKHKDGEKIDDQDGAFPVANNDYKSGDLTFEKVLDGNYIDKDDEFTVTVTLTAKDGKTLNREAIKNRGATVNDDGTFTYTVKDDSNFTINNIPYDVDYEVVETGNDNYTPKYKVSYENESGEIKADQTDVTITNTRNKDIATGVNLDNIPYIFTMVAALAGMAFAFVRKRRVN